MYKAFEIAGYTREDVDTQLLRNDQRLQVRRSPTWRFSAGLDRIVMLLADEPNIREGRTVSQ